MKMPIKVNGPPINICKKFKRRKLLEDSYKIQIYQRLHLRLRFPNWLSNMTAFPDFIKTIIWTDKEYFHKQ